MEEYEKTMLKEICSENLYEYRLIKDLLEIQRNKSLMNRRRGLNDELEAKVESYIKRNKV